MNPGHGIYSLAGEPTWQVPVFVRVGYRPLRLASGKTPPLEISLPTTKVIGYCSFCPFRTRGLAEGKA